MMLAQTAAAQQIAVPSGLDLSLYEVILEDTPPVARFRFLAPEIAPGIGRTFTDVVDDLQAVCDAVIVPALHRNGWQAGEIVVSMSDRPVAFGLYDAQVTQYFQPFQLLGDACIPEDF